MKVVVEPCRLYDLDSGQVFRDATAASEQVFMIVGDCSNGQRQIVDLDDGDLSTVSANMIVTPLWGTLIVSSQRKK